MCVCVCACDLHGLAGGCLSLPLLPSVVLPWREGLHWTGVWGAADTEYQNASFITKIKIATKFTESDSYISKKNKNKPSNITNHHCHYIRLLHSEVAPIKPHF